MVETSIQSLAGLWSCRLDPEHRGIHEAWQMGATEQHRVTLPGSTQTNGIGPAYTTKQISNLTPATEYIGPAWYWRDIELSNDDCQQVLELYLERACWESFVWLNGTALGTRDSLVAPHVYDLSLAAKPGINRLTILVDNANLKNKDANASSKMSEDEELVIEANSERRLHCGGHHTSFGGFVWNGITGRIELSVRPRVRISPPQAYPDVAQKRVMVKCNALNDIDVPVAAKLILDIGDQSTEVDLIVEPGSHQVVVEVDLREGLRLWDEHSPERYALEATIRSAHGVDRHGAEFGMRSLSRIGNQVAINGRKSFLRGALEKFVHPLTGFPPTDLAYWLKIFGVHKDHGLNHLRFHSCCPPEAAFAAADRLGLILNVELPGASGAESDDLLTQNYMQSEALRILDTFGNHPSFCMLTMGNEILSDEVDEAAAQARLMKRVARCKAHDPRHWYCCTAHAYTSGRDDDFYVTAWPNAPTAAERHSGEPLRGFRWNGGDVVDDSRFNTRSPETTTDYREGIAGIDKPVITHEVGMWAVYPDISEAPRFDGVMKAFNLNIIREFMQSKGTIDLADDFVKASGELSLQLYKEEIESALRTPGLSGFQLLGIHDHPPQGTSTIGIVTALRESKGIIGPAAFREFCSDTVPLARIPKRTFTFDETFTAFVEVAHYGASDLSRISATWRLSSASEEVFLKGRFKAADLPSGICTELGNIEVDLSAFSKPAKLRLEVVLEGTEARNTWDCWVYPPPVTEEPKGVIWARCWSHELATSVEAGETAILELGGDQIPHAVRGCFTTVLWNAIMKRRHRSQTMGVLCDPSHPALLSFPTEPHSNWQWWDVLQPSRVFDLDAMSPRPEPLVRMIDSFIGNRCLSVLFEVRMGMGRLLVTSLDLSSDLTTRHAARQLRASLRAYVTSYTFDPSLTIVPDDIDRLIAFHQREPIVPTRAEICAQFDQLVVRDPKGTD
jgi:hypothetical protein